MKNTQLHLFSYYLHILNVQAVLTDTETDLSFLFVRRRGVPRELWDAAMEELPDSGAVLDALIQKKCRGELSDPREIKRVSDSLLRRGFSWGEVRSALSRYTELAEE